MIWISFQLIFQATFGRVWKRFWLLPLGSCGDRFLNIQEYMEEPSLQQRITYPIQMLSQVEAGKP